MLLSSLPHLHKASLYLSCVFSHQGCPPLDVRQVDPSPLERTQETGLSINTRLALTVRRLTDTIRMVMKVMMTVTTLMMAF